MRHIASLFLIAFIVLITACRPAEAKPKYLFKIGSLAPEGSVWVLQFHEFAREVEEKTGGEVGFRVYSGGIMGDDQAMYRKMRVGQLQGGGFTMTGIAQVVPDFRVMALPFFFSSYAEVDAVTKGLMPIFQRKFTDQGMEFIAMTEVGFLYTMSTVPITTLKELQGTTCWIPSGDPLAAAFLGQLAINPIQLSIPDVLSSLQTGLVNTVFNSLYGSIVLQWFTKARYINDTPFGYAYGVFLLDGKAMQKLPKGHAAIIQAAADRYFPALIQQTRESNSESKEILEKQGVQFSRSTPEFVTQLHSFRDKTAEQLVGSAFSREIYEEAVRLLHAHRAARPEEASP
jgi:TRAP-type C4-dicarboxylate transport system substrate-binding protein